MPSLVVVVGNPAPKSRTRTIAEELGRRIASSTGAAQLPTIELADHTEEIFRRPSERLDPLLERLASAEYAVIASPTYKASYTGLLKGFLDRYGAGGLAGVTAFPVFTIGTPAHALAVEFTLRPLLVELGASLPLSGLAFETSRFEERSTLLDEWIEREAWAIPRR